MDPAAEWRQSYAEAGRLIRAYFWEPGMCGIDWDAVLDQYRPLVERVASPDEFADLLATKSMREAFLNSVQRLCAKARAAGVHLVLATERPEAKTVPGVIKTNLVGRVALKVADVAASRVVIGQAGAEMLLGKGDLYADFGAGPMRGQAALLGVAP